MSPNTTPRQAPFYQSYTSPPVTIVLTVLLLIFFFIGFFSVYFCRCIVETLTPTRTLRRSASAASIGGRANPAAAASSPGLPISIIQTFPTFAYAAVKGFRRDEFGLECAICLTEFQDDAVLRLLTGCCHVFHRECVDLWLESHRTCPVCRRSLDSPARSPVNLPAVLDPEEEIPGEGREAPVEAEDEDGDSIDETFSIDLKRDYSGGGARRKVGSCSSARQVLHGRTPVNPGGGDGERFSRSHSTGHSPSGRSRGEEDRFTLRLPENVKVKIDGGGYNSTDGPPPFGEISTQNREISGNACNSGEGSAVAGAEIV